MAKHIWSVLCRKVIIDKNDNSLSLIEVVEGVEVVSLPASSVQASQMFMDLVTYWRRSYPSKVEHATARLVIKDPGGKAVGLPHEIPIALEEAPRIRCLLRFQGGVPYTKNGVYEYMVQLKYGGSKWGTVAQIPLEITIKPAPSAPKH